MANNFWTTAAYQPMQQFRYDVQTILFKANFSSISSEGRVLVNQPQSTEVVISKELIKAVNMPDVTFGYDNDAANIGSDGPNMESQDPQMAELELQLYMTPQLAQDIQDIFRTYYLQDVEEVIDGIFEGRPSKILNKDRVSLIPSPLFIKKSAIIVNIYPPSNNATKESPATPAKSIRYYGVYPVSYNLGGLDYSSSDVVVGSVKFYFYGVDIKNPEDAENSSQLETEILSSIERAGKPCMGNY